MERATGFNESLDLQDDSITRGNDVFDKISNLNEQLNEIQAEIEEIKGEAAMYNTQSRNVVNTKTELLNISKRTDDLSRRLRTITNDYDKVRQHVESSSSLDKDNNKARLDILKDNIARTIANLMGMQTELKGNVKEKVTRLVAAVTHDDRVLEDEDIDKILEVGLQEVISAQIGGEELEIDTLLSRAANTYQGLTKLNQSINELKQMFEDFNILLEDQTERLKTAENHVEDAKEHILEGKEDIAKGLEYQKKAKKKKKCIIIILVAVILVVAIIAGTIVAVAL